jgi:hypothetical protein
MYRNESSENAENNLEAADPNRIRVEKLDLKGVEISLVSCDHQPERMPKVDPWENIENQISESSLTFVEYFPYELERTVYNNPIWGKLARKAGEAKGINQFFNKVAEISKKHDKEIAVADIANSAIYSSYHAGLRTIPGPLISLATQSNPGTIAGILAFNYGNAMTLQENLGIGLFDLERKDFERFAVDMEDARRLFTARGIEQEADRRVEGTKFSYIAPRAHVSRVKWYLENPDDLPTKTKSKFYSLAVGLPRSTRIYKNSHMFNTWQLVSEVPTKP